MPILRKDIIKSAFALYTHITGFTHPRKESKIAARVCSIIDKLHKEM